MGRLVKLTYINYKKDVVTREVTLHDEDELVGGDGVVFEDECGLLMVRMRDIIEITDIKEFTKPKKRITMPNVNPLWVFTIILLLVILAIVL
jgi:hypothetical protein